MIVDSYVKLTLEKNDIKVLTDAKKLLKDMMKKCEGDFVNVEIYRDDTNAEMTDYDGLFNAYMAMDRLFQGV